MKAMIVVYPLAAAMVLSVLGCTNPAMDTVAATPDRRVAAFSSGPNCSAAVMADGSLWTWGRNESGVLGTGQPSSFIAYSPARVGGDSDWAAVSCGPSHVLALKKDGSLYAWGQANSGAIGDGGSGGMQTQPVRVGTDKDWKYIHAGYQASYAIKNDGRLFAWGLNSNGKLGDGTTETRLAPVQIGPGAAWRQVACGEYHCLGIQEDGSLWSWGSNEYGALGLGSGTAGSLLPSRVGSASSWTAVAVNSCYSLGLRNDGSLWSWGYNTQGQLGYGPPSSTVYVPTQVGADTDWRSVSAGSNHALAIKESGDLYSWGGNSSGQIGNGRPLNHVLAPTLLDAGGGWDLALAAADNSFARKADGRWYAWGSNQRAQFGDGSSSAGAAPRAIVTASMKAFASVCCSPGGFSLAIASDGTLWSWGNNANGCLGDGGTTSRYQPVQVGGADNWLQAACGGLRCFAINDAGELYAWGKNGQGQLGLGGPYEDILIPTRVGTASDWRMVAVGNGHALGLKSDGSLWAWGTESYGELGNGADGQIAAPARLGDETGWTWIAAGGSSSFAIQNGALFAWGSNNGGQLGDGTTDNYYDIPMRIGGLNDWHKVYIQSSKAGGIRSGGSLWTWGDGLLCDGNSAGSPLPVQIGAGKSWQTLSLRAGGGCALSSDGSLWVWGGNTYFASGVVPSTSTILTLTRLGPERAWLSGSAGTSHGAAVAADGGLWAWGTPLDGAAGYDSSKPMLMPWRGLVP